MAGTQFCGEIKSSDNRLSYPDHNCCEDCDDDNFDHDDDYDHGDIHEDNDDDIDADNDDDHACKNSFAKSAPFLLVTVESDIERQIDLSDDHKFLIMAVVGE